MADAVTTPPVYGSSNGSPAAALQYMNRKYMFNVLMEQTLIFHEQIVYPPFSIVLT